MRQHPRNRQPLLLPARERLSALRQSRSPDGRLRLYQPLTLLWSFGRAHQGFARMTEWPQTETALGEFLQRHGEYPRPHYPVAALYHAGLWELGGPRPVPPAHGNDPVHWFASTQPAGGLRAPVYNLVRYSGEARVSAVATIVDRYLQVADAAAILRDAELTDDDIAGDEVPVEDVVVPRSPLEEEYRRLCGSSAQMIAAPVRPAADKRRHPAKEVGPPGRAATQRRALREPALHR